MCRTNVISNINGPEQFTKRGNNAPVSMNLVRLAMLASKKCEDETAKVNFFFDKLFELLELSERALLHRHETLCKLKGKDVPFITENNMFLGCENIGPEDSIEPYLKNNSYSIGLAI